MLNPEKAYMQKYGASNFNLTDAEKIVHKNLVSKHRKSVPELDVFQGLYPDEEIQADKKVVERITREKKEKTVRAEILEAVLTQQIEQSEWLGGNCRAYPTTEYDDFINHTDLVVQLEKTDGKIISLGIDVTTDTNEDRLKEKIDWTIKEIDEGRLSEIK